MVYPIRRQSQHPYRQNHFSQQGPGGHHPQQPAQRSSSPNSPIKALAARGLGDVSKTLSNVDQVIKVVRSASPIVQEYGPMIRNLPAIYRMVKALGQPDDHPVQTDDTHEASTQTEQGYSTPKLYI